MSSTLPIVVFVLLVASADRPEPVRVTAPQRVQALGQTRDRLSRAYARLCSAPLNDLVFVLADVSLQMKRRFTNYSGDISGRMIGALNETEGVLARRTPLLSALLAELPKYQKPDGHFGADQDLDHLVQTRDMPILWGNGRLLLGLAERCQSHPDRRLLAVARRLGEYVISTRPYYGKKENFQNIGGVAASGYTTCYPSMIDALVALGRVTGDERFFSEARFIGRLSLLDKAFHRHHSHGRLVAWRGMLDLDRSTGTGEFVEAIRLGCTHVAGKYLFPTGGVPEYFDQAYHRDEGCSVADWIRVQFLLWLATGDTDHLDAADHTLRNHMLAMQFHNGGFGHRDFATLNHRGKAYGNAAVMPGGAESYWCCSMHCTQLLAESARWALVPSGRDVFVTWLGESRIVLESEGTTLAMAVRRQARGCWTVSVRADRPTETTLHLRVPRWANRIEVDGKPVEAKSGWADIPRTWNDSTELRVTFPDHIRLAGVSDATPQPGEPVRVFAGPDLFCLPDAFLDDHMLDSKSIPVVYLNARRPIDGAIPVVVEAASGKRQNARLVPMCNRPLGGAHFLFDVRQIGEADFKAVSRSAAAERKPGACIKMAFACDGTCDVYLNGKLVGRQAGWQNGNWLIAFSRRPKNTVALIVRSKAERPGLIGIVQLGKRTYVTQASGWSAAPAPENLTPQMLGPTTGTAPIPGTTKLVDLGPLGVAPWRYVPGNFMQSKARWIWPQTDTADREQVWLFRLDFQ